MSLAGRSALVTGGGRGIGAAVARALAAAGAAVVVSARTAGEIEAVAGELAAGGARAAAIPCDVTDPESVAALAERAASEIGAIDILVNNAGASASAPLRHTDLELWRRMLEVNATSVYLCTRAFLPAMLERGWGRVINVASIAGKMGAAYISAYSAAKHAAVGFTRSVAMEVAAKGVTVNAVCPGYVETSMTDESIVRISAKTGLTPEEARERLRRQSPQGRIYRPEEVAWLAVTLCGEEADGINGQAIVLDGGSVQS